MSSELEECEIEVGDEEFEFFDEGECVVFENQPERNRNFSYDKTYWLPGVSFSWGLAGRQFAAVNGSAGEFETIYHTTMYGGYNRGVTIPVQREGTLSATLDELGDNFQLGVRSTGIKGVTFDVAGFFKNDRELPAPRFCNDGPLAWKQHFHEPIDEVQISGVEMYGRLDTRPYTGWNLNPFFEGNFHLLTWRDHGGRTA